MFFSIWYYHQNLPLFVYEVPAIRVNTTKSTYTFTNVRWHIRTTKGFRRKYVAFLKISFPFFNNLIWQKQITILLDCIKTILAVDNFPTLAPPVLESYFGQLNDFYNILVIANLVILQASYHKKYFTHISVSFLLWDICSKTTQNRNSTWTSDRNLRC